MTKLTTPASAPTTTKPRGRVNWTAAERAEWLELYKQSGQSGSEFCRANDLLWSGIEKRVIPGIRAV